MRTRTALAFTAVLLTGLAGSAGTAWAQFFPPPPPIEVPSPFGSLPPVAPDNDANLPPYDPPPGYRQPGVSAAQPPRTYEPEALPPPGPFGHVAPPPPQIEPAYPPPGGYRESYPPPQPGYEPRPPEPADRQYGGLPPVPPLFDILRPPGAVGPAPGQADPEVTSRLPEDIRPESGPRKELPAQFRRATVDYRTREPVGTLIVDTQNTYLYLVLGNGKAMRYGIGVGREGFTWSGTERVSRMAEWPDWHPPAEMIERQPYLPRFMAGGEGNPLGARALYLGRTIYRIHGTNQPSTIGTFVSSGCIRLTNEDVIDLYYRVKVGTRVVVLPGKPPATASAAPSGPPAPRPYSSQPPYPAQSPYASQPPAGYGEPIPLDPPPVIRAR
jgi:lipoprotein-anchoring transpeptidase ErfK/SrfK